MAERTANTSVWQRPRPPRASLRRDAIVAGALVPATLVSTMIYASIASFPPADWWVSAPWSILIAGSLAWRRRYPAVVAVLVAALFAAGQLLDVPEILFSNICLFVALYSLGAWGRDRRVATVVRLVIVVGMFLWLFSALVVNASDPCLNQIGDGHGTLQPYVALASLQVLQNLLYFAGAYFFGNNAWSSALARDQLETRTLELQSERERSQSQAVVLERVRIARELHDVVAHHVSVMGVQAGAARRVLGTVRSDSDPVQLEKAVSAVSAIEANAREAVDDLHRLLGALRQPGSTPRADEASTHGVDQLPELVEQTRAAGLTVDFSVVGAPRPLSPTTSLNVYRIAQEALTNVRKHAGTAARVDARLRYLDEAVEIEVSDSGRAGRVVGAGTGRGSGMDTDAGAGLGQIGMRERVDAVGGTLEISARARGGYIVRARLPTTAAEVLS